MYTRLKNDNLFVFILFYFISYRYLWSTTTSSNRCGGKEKRIVKSASTPSCRTPLIIVTLFIPTEAKTLAPKDLKRDQRRRPPSFCQNFQRQASLNDQCSCKTNTELDFLVRGKEIHESGHNSITIEEVGVISTVPGADDTVENDEFNSCCACFIEMEKENSILVVPTTVDQTELCVNLDNYQMDSNGNLPPVPAIPITKDIAVESDGQSSITTKRIRSPSTSQIIRITMNNRNVDSICKDDDEWKVNYTVFRDSACICVLNWNKYCWWL